MDTKLREVTGTERATAESFLLRTIKALEASKPDAEAMADAAEEAARRLSSGGQLWVSGMPPMQSEFSGRAGGFMSIRRFPGKLPAHAGDVFLHFPWTEGTAPVVEAGASPWIVTLGGPGGGTAGRHFPHHADVAGVSPTLASVILGWIFTGELIAALTRLGKMPVLYESMGMPDGVGRIQRFQNGDIAFHDGLHVPPVAVGVIARRYIDAVTVMLRRVEDEQRDNLNRAGAWAREAKATGKRLFMYSMGHLFPAEIEKTEIGRVFRSALWNAGFPHHPKPNDLFGPGDLAVHISYQQPPDDLLRRARPAGARVVYVSIRSDRDYVHDPEVAWIDPMWDWPDACVPIDGYDVAILPASGVVNAAIAWEIYRLQT